MSLIPGIKMIGGKGKPRLEVIYLIDLYTTVGATTFTATTFTEAGSPSLLAIQGRMRAESMYVNGTQQVPCWGRVASVDDATDTVTVDDWYPNTPTNGQVVHVNGRVVDLPYCRQLMEERTPEQIVHDLWNYIIDNEWHGWEYRAFLDYSQHLYGVILQDMAPVLNISPGDRLILTPRVDQRKFAYNVIYDPGSTVRLARYGYAEAHREAVFAFRSKELVNWPTSSGYGTNYSTVYGTCL